MSESPILAIPQVEELQNNKYVTVNDAIELLEAATQDRYENAAVGAGPVNLTEPQATQAMVYRVAGSSGAFNLVFPTTINGNNAKRWFAVENAASHACTVKAAGSGTTVVVAPGTRAICYQVTDDIAAYASFSPTLPYDIGLYIPGMPDDGVEVAKFTAVRAFSLPDNFAGSQGHCGANPTALATFTIKKNGSTIGTLEISTLGVFTFATTGSGDETFAAGDRLSIEAPSPQDATLSNVSIMLLGSRSA